jgi:hypothetical protein
VTGPNDLLQAAGVQDLVQVAEAPIGTVTSSAVLTISGGTGKYAGATGNLNLSGTGRNVFGPAAGPGIGTFDLVVVGTYCIP